MKTTISGHWIRLRTFRGSSKILTHIFWSNGIMWNMLQVIVWTNGDKYLSPWNVTRPNESNSYVYGSGCQKRPSLKSKLFGTNSMRLTILNANINRKILQIKSLTIRSWILEKHDYWNFYFVSSPFSPCWKWYGRDYVSPYFHCWYITVLYLHIRVQIYLFGHVYSDTIFCKIINNVILTFFVSAISG